ncbi:hypothetical protein NB689_002909 [Xanthomonas sacchari]|nr:hypothetical protein [Xanthomonas sacchari]
MLCETSSPAIAPASKIIRSMKPMLAPTASSRATLSTTAALNPSQSGTGGRIGASAIASVPARITRTRPGTALLPTIGITVNIAPIRSIVHSTAPIIANARDPSTTICVAASISPRPR